MRTSIVAILCIAIMVSCNSTPSGFTPEAWERIQREHPNQADALKWIEGDPTRSKIRQIYLSHMWDTNRDLGDAILIRAANFEIQEGQPGAFRVMVVEVLKDRIRKDAINPNDNRAQKALTAIESL